MKGHLEILFGKLQEKQNTEIRVRETGTVR